MFLFGYHLPPLIVPYFLSLLRRNVFSRRLRGRRRDSIFNSLQPEFVNIMVQISLRGKQNKKRFHKTPPMNMRHISRFLLCLSLLLGFTVELRFCKSPTKLSWFDDLKFIHMLATFVLDQRAVPAESASILQEFYVILLHWRHCCELVTEVSV
jgi:hypothetical protein